jgi:hypothetical protein
MSMIDLLYVKGLSRKLSAVRKMRAVMKGK